MPKSKQWILYAEQLDPLGLHEYFGFEVARATGEYTPRTQYCEVPLHKPSSPLLLEKKRAGVESCGRIASSLESHGVGGGGTDWGGGGDGCDVEIIRVESLPPFTNQI